MKKNLLIFLLCLLPVFSCSQKAVVSSDILPYVNDILSDTTKVWNKALASYERSADSHIAVVGQKEDVGFIAQSLHDCDLFDNGSFETIPDYLYDFAGETIDAYEDNSLIGSYNTYFTQNGIDSLRTSAVNLSLAAICDKYWSTKYEKYPDLSKRSVKLIVLASAQLSLCGLQDVEYLFENAGVDVKLVNPFEAIADELQSRNLSDVIVWTQLDSIFVPRYKQVLESSLQSSAVNLFIDSDLDYERQFEAIFGSYYERNAGHPALVVDHKVNREQCLLAMENYMERVNGEDSEEMAALRKKMTSAPDIIFVEDAIGKSCYRWLRENDMLTLRIAEPLSVQYKLTTYKGKCSAVRL